MKHASLVAGVTCSAPPLMMLTIIAHMAQVVGKDISVSGRKAIVLADRSESVHYVIQFVFIEATLGKLVLQLIQFENRSGQSGLIACEGKC